MKHLQLDETGSRDQRARNTPLSHHLWYGRRVSENLYEAFHIPEKAEMALVTNVSVLRGTLSLRMFLSVAICSQSSHELLCSCGGCKVALHILTAFLLVCTAGL